MNRSPARFLPEAISAEQVIHCLGLVSDTHMPERRPDLPPALFEIFDGVDLVLHAGDVGALWVLDRLSLIAPVVAVHGNDDTEEAHRELPYEQVVAVAGRRLLLYHSHHQDPLEEAAARRDDAWLPKLDQRAALGRRAGATVVVFGHTHIPMALRHREVLLVNAGALASGSWTGRQKVQTVALLFVLKEGEVVVVHVDLAAPDRAFTPRVRWDAGYDAALAEINAPTLTPPLAADWPRLKRPLRALTPAQSRSLLLPLAHRCWNGEQDIITHADLLAAVQAHTDIPEPIRVDLETILLRQQGR